MIACEIFSHVYFAKPPESLSCAYLDSHVRFGFQGLNWASKVNVGIRPVTSLGHQEGRRVFRDGLKIFEICPIFSNYIQHIFSVGRNVCIGFSPPCAPLVTGLVRIRPCLGLYFRTRSMLQN